MNVKEIVDVLQKFPADIEVMIDDGFETFALANSFAIRDITTINGSEFYDYNEVEADKEDPVFRVLVISSAIEEEEEKPEDKLLGEDDD